ncbi:MAG: AbrB/MazE/SpoVT family DNA-binding domain-containing protein [Planctomycetota bacterium]
MNSKLIKTAEGLAVVLDAEMLNRLGLSEGDAVSVAEGDGVIELRPEVRHASDAAFDEAAAVVLRDRSALLKRLA